MSHIELAIATDFLGESPEIEKVEETLKKIAEAGFTHIHWCHEWDGDYIYSTYEMLQIKEWMDKYGLRAKGIHATKGSRRPIERIASHYRKDYTSEIIYNRKAGVELIKNRVDLAECIGANEIVLHLYVPYEAVQNDLEAKDRFYEQVYASLDELEPYCLQKGVRICMENLFDMPQAIVEESLERMFQKYDKAFLGFCIDTGHANMVWQDDMTAIIEKYKDRLYAMHLHDNDQKGDGHHLPGNGTIKWPAVMASLAKTAYEEPLVFELACHEENVDMFLEKAYQVSKDIQALYKGAKHSLLDGIEA
ncbi:MAG: sugar phosphate isomerase/epimerase family protein [Cellulosilyticaceae bacterium]